MRAAAISFDSSSTPSAPLLAFTLSHASQTSRLEIANGLPSGFGSHTGSSRVITVDQSASHDDPPPSLRPHYQASSLPRGGPPLCPASVLSPSRIGRLGISLPHATAGHCCATGRPRARNDRFPRSTPKPGPSSRHLHAGQHLGRKQVSPRLIPGQDPKPGFAVASGVFDTSSVVRSRSPSWPTPDALHGAPFPQRSAPRLLTGAPCGGLRPPPAGRPRRPTQPTGPAPPSPMQHRTSQPSLLHPDLLMRSRHTNLQLLGATPPPHEPHQREQVPDNEIDERPEQAALLGHGNRAPNLASPARQRAAN